MVPDITASSMQFSSFLAGNTGVGVGVEGSTVVFKKNRRDAGRFMLFLKQNGSSSQIPPGNANIQELVLEQIGFYL